MNLNELDGIKVTCYGCDINVDHVNAYNESFLQVFLLSSSCCLFVKNFFITSVLGTDYCGRWEEKGRKRFVGTVKGFNFFKIYYRKTANRQP